MSASDSKPSDLPGFRLDALFEFSPDAVVALDNDLRVVYWNHSAEEMYGWSSDEAVGRVMCDLVRQVWLDPKDERRSKQSLETKGTWRGELDHVRRNGWTIHVESMETVLRDTNGIRVGLLTCIRDLSERRAVSERTFAAETEFRALIDSNIMGVVRLTDEGIVSVNDYFCQILGYSRQELLSGAINWRDLTASDYHDAVGERMARLSKKGYVRPYESMYRRKDGSQASVLVWLVLTRQDPIEWLAFVRDQTERKAIEQRALAAESLFRTLIDSNIIGIVRSNEAGFVSVNDNFCRMVGFTQHELQSGAINWRTMTIPDELATLEGRLKQLKTDGYVMPFSQKYRRKDGSMVSVLMCSILTRTEPYEWLSIVQDVSALVALKESEETNRAIIDILADGVVVRNAEGKIVSANASAARLFGVRPDQLVGAAVDDPRLQLVAEDGSFMPLDQRPYMIALRSDKIVKDRVVGIRKSDGSVVWTRTNARQLHDPTNGMVKGVVTSFSDITDLKKAEQDQRERAEREALINRLNEAIRFAFNPLTIQQKVTFLISEALHLDRCYYVRYDPLNDVMYRSTDYHRSDLPSIAGEASVSEFAHTRGQLFADGTAVYGDIFASDLPEETKAIHARFDRRAFVAVPFFDGGICTAALVAAMTEPRQWTKNEIQLIEQAAAMTYSAVMAADIVSREMGIARRLQDAMLPSIPAQIAGLNLASFYRPALEEARVGGDFMDVFSADNNSAFLVMGDVSGKGLAAASQVAIVRNMLRYALLSSDHLDIAVSNLNDIIADHDQLNGFVTLFIARYSSNTRMLTYVNCGHEPGLLKRSFTGTIEHLTPTGTVLGAIEGAVFEARSVRLAPGDLLIMYTDGLSDVGDQPDALLTDEGIARLIRAHHPVEEPQEIVDSLMAEVDEHSQGSVRDDQCLMVAIAQQVLEPFDVPTRSIDSVRTMC